MSLLLLFFSNFAMAGDVLKSGTKLTEDSYVMTLTEAQEIKNQIQELEFKINNAQSEIEQYQKLDQLQEQEIQELNQIVEMKQTEVDTYKNLIAEYDEQMQKLQKHRDLEKVILVGGSILGTVGLLFVADTLDHSIQNYSGQLSNVNQLQRGLTVRF